MVAHRVRVSRCHTGGRSSRRRVTLPVTKCPVDETTTYCDRLVQDMPFLTGLGRLSEQQVDRIILQLNRYYPQILSNKDAEKVPRNLRLLFHPFPLWAGRSGGQDSLEFRNPKVSLRVRLCDLLGHLQRSGERDCQEFYRALYIHAQPLHSCLPSRHALQNSDCTELDSGTAGRELSDRGNRLPCPFSLFPHPRFHLCLGGFSIPSRVPFLASCWTDPLRVLTGCVPAQLTPAQGVSLSLEASGPLPPSWARGAAHVHFSPGPVAFLTCLGLAAGLALLVYCCPPDPKVLPGARRVLGFSPVIVDRHVSRFLLAFLTDDLGGL
ncbi:caspase recruitment domain-containing protein 19 isoform X3 [Lagenorhynchus albirostris]|uniref:caspase recruitment domain-containing protein 19 isoform X3 n=1 Tax=Lagenorhynchus albirostris TaxID=27610 RepID=UPI0028E97D2B|nr:caspase recruitment domain-containing protein 19 isoform X3 [Lagenorhynchus albirostris]